MQIVPPVSAPPQPTIPAQPTSPYTAPAQPTTQRPAGYPPQQRPANPVSGQPVSGQPVSPMHPAAYPQQRPVLPQQPVAQPVSAPSWPVTAPAVPPQKKGRGGLIAALGGSVLALVLVIAGIVWAVGRKDNQPGGGGDDPSQQANPAVSPACGHKIGFLGKTSGDADDGVLLRNSVKLAIDDFNAKNPGCHVDFKEFDTAGTDEGSKAKAQLAVDDPQVIGIVGPMYETEILAAGKILDDGKLPMMVPFASSDKLAKQGWSMFHRVIASEEDQARAGARYLKNTLKAKKTAIVYDDSDFGTSGRQQVSNELGAATGQFVQIRQTDTDFASAVKQVTDSNPDAVYFAGQSTDGTAFVKALRTAKPTLPVVSADTLFTQEFVTGTGGKAEGVVVTAPCVPSKDAGNDFASKYQGAFGEASSYYGPEAYDAAVVFLDGFRAGNGTREQMTKFLSTYDGKGPTTGREIKFDGSGNLASPDMVIWAFKVQQTYMVKDSVIAP
jgi:branched-chain amino acid transport system substrate-binding protein